jgi:hypothetical protein
MGSGVTADEWASGRCLSEEALKEPKFRAHAYSDFLSFNRVIKRHNPVVDQLAGFDGVIAVLDVYKVCASLVVLVQREEGAEQVSHNGGKLRVGPPVQEVGEELGVGRWEEDAGVAPVELRGRGSA